MSPPDGCVEERATNAAFSRKHCCRLWHQQRYLSLFSAKQFCFFLQNCYICTSLCRGRRKKAFASQINWLRTKTEILLCSVSGIFVPIRLSAIRLRHLLIIPPFFTKQWSVPWDREGDETMVIKTPAQITAKWTVLKVQSSMPAKIGSCEVFVSFFFCFCTNDFLKEMDPWSMGGGCQSKHCILDGIRWTHGWQTSCFLIWKVLSLPGGHVRPGMYHLLFWLGIFQICSRITPVVWRQVPVCLSLTLWCSRISEKKTKRFSDKIPQYPAFVVWLLVSSPEHGRVTGTQLLNLRLIPCTWLSASPWSLDQRDLAEALWPN